MQKIPNPKLNIPKEIRDSISLDLDKKKIIDAVENYVESMKGCIFTHINMDYEISNPIQIHAWIQRLLSVNVLRSFYIRNSFVDAFNSKNPVGIFLALKAWFEVAGVLASILDLLEEKSSDDILREKLKPYALGNRGKGSLRVGEIDAKNVMTMLTKADKYIKNISKGLKKIEKEGNFFIDFYDIASNPTHPSFEAYEMFGELTDNGVWMAYSPNEIRLEIVSDFDKYGALLMAPIFIKSICQKILIIELKHFRKMGSKKYND
ncbi:MAG: hypothetical protein WCO09_03980 [bacterium]